MKARSEFWINSFILGIALSSFGLTAWILRSHSDHSVIQYRFIVLGLVLGFSLLATIFLLSSRAKLRIILILFSVVLSIYLFEGIVRLLPKKNLFEAAMLQQGLSFDERTPFEFMKEERSKGHETYPRMGGANFLEAPLMIDQKATLPLSGVSMSPSFTKYENGTFLLYQSDEHGFHNPTGLWSAGSLKIAAIGDSFTFGASTSSESNFVALISHQFKQTLNLGHGGNGPLIELATLKEYLPAMRPEITLWCYFEGNDLEDLNHEKKNSILLSYLTSNNSQGLMSKQPLLDDAIKNRIILEADCHGKVNRLQNLKEFIKLRGIRERFGLLIQDPSDFNLFGQILTEAKQSVEAWNGKLIFVYLPAWERYGTHQVDDRDREQILRVVQRLNIPMVDIHRAFQQQPDPLSFFPFRLNAHYNESGHKVVANEILKVLNEASTSSP